MNVKDHIIRICGNDQGAEIVAWCWLETYTAAKKVMKYSDKEAKAYATDMLTGKGAEKIKIKGYNPDAFFEKLAITIINEYNRTK